MQDVQDELFSRALSETTTDRTAGEYELANDPAITHMLEVGYRDMPDVELVAFDLDTYEVADPEDPRFPTFPWKPYSCPASTTSMLALFDETSTAELTAACGRARLTARATTTVRNFAGQPQQLTIFVLASYSSYALALIAPLPLLHVPSSVDKESIRTRMRFNRSGEILEADGPQGSFARPDIELGPWAERLIASTDLDNYRAGIQAVLADEPYAAVHVAGAIPGLRFECMIVAVEDEVMIDLFDRSHQFAAFDALQRSQTQFDQLSSTLPLGVFVVEAEGKTRFASERLQEMLGPSIASEFGWLESIHPDDQEIAADAFVRLPQTRGFNFEIRARRTDGEYAWYRWAGSDVRDESGALQFVIGFVEDISEWRELNSQIAYQANFDGLTGLPNRISLEEELRSRVMSQDPSMQTGVLFIDLDGFKLINDTQGHSVGDIVLVEVAQRFRRALRPDDVIGRFGGDEFVVVASEISDAQETEAIARRLHDVLSTPVLADGRIIAVSASIGIGLSGDGPSSSEQLIGDADIAMYEAKASGRNNTVTFDATLRARASQRFDMTADLRHARRRRELRLEYQPIVDLKTEAIVGAEALVRWEHPAMGLISPGVFVPLAEEIGLIDDVGGWVVEQACADLDRLRGHQLVDDDFVISVNASAQQFANVAILATSSLASLDQYGLKPSNLRFELTESVPLTEIPNAANRIRQLTSYGFGLAIDDFGTGYSSLGYLTMLPFDVLKLDLSLTAQLEAGAPSLAVVDSLTRMALEMDFQIVAEGIETDKQRALLSEAGVELGQGYYLSRPLRLGGLIDLLEE